MARLFKQEGQPMHLVNEWMATSIEDMKSIDLSYAAPGSVCIVVQTNSSSTGTEEFTATMQKYILLETKIWVRFKEDETAEIVPAKGVNVEYVYNEENKTYEIVITAGGN